MKLYHGTDGRNIRRILRDGIHPRKITRKNNWGHSVPSNPHAVYLTTAYAGYFAMLASKSGLLGIVEVDSDKLDEDLLRPVISIL
jgi:methionyl-tRNA synthetase